MSVQSHGPSASRRGQIVAPLLRRESMGDAYHVLFFDAGAELAAAPGQFLMVRGLAWGDAPLLPRPMSILSAGATPSMLVKVVGDGTTRLARAEPGERFSLVGPLGVGWRPAHPTRRQLLVAGGVGVAPLLFLARGLAESGRKPVVIYGGRSAKDLPLNDDLEQVSTLQLTTEDGSRGTRGRVTDVLERHLADDVEVFTCGPHRMMAAVAQICASRDVPYEASLETPMACGYGVCLGCPVPTTEGGYLYACTEGPCVDARRIDWSAGDQATKAAGSSPR